jgi:DNA-binding LytR/AlgR family response regulator
MKKIFLIEDEWVHAEDIRIAIEEMNYQWLGYTHEGIDAMEKIKELQPDVVLIDLNLNGAFSGIAIARTIKEKFNLPFIFATSYLDDEIIKQCYEVGPVAYLHKPINKGDLKAALLKVAFTELQTTEEEVIVSDTNGHELMIRVGKNLKPLPKEDITVIHTDAKNYIRIFTRQKTQYAVKSSLTSFEKNLPAKFFMRVHKEYLVNLQYITGVNESDQTIQIDHLHIPLGKNYRAEFFSRYTIL